MHEEVGGRGLPSRVVLEEGAERGLQLTGVVAVVDVERPEQRIGERAQRVGVGHRQEQPVGPEVVEPRRAPAFEPAHLQGVSRLAETASDVLGWYVAAGPGPELRSQTLSDRLAESVQVAVGVGREKDVDTALVR